MVRLLISGAIAFTAACVDTSPEAKARAALDTAQAITAVLCEDAMNARLRSPGSADYPFGHSTNVRATGPNRYRLASYVDAQNVVGASVRTDFACDVEGSGELPSGYRVLALDAQPR